MDKRVLLIGTEKSFMVNAITNGLKKEGYEVVFSAPGVNEVSRTEDKPKIWVLYIDENVEALAEFLVFLKDMVEEEEIRFYAIGNPDEIATVTGIVGRTNISESFERPLNIKLLTQAMDKAVEAGTLAEQKKRILIIDDNAATLRMMKNLLSEKYNVFMANSGMNGITFLAKNEVDLILLDYEMPVTSGPQVLEMLRSEENTRNIPVMFLTAKGDKESVLKVVSLKPEKYLLKSMPPQELIKNIDEFFESRKKG